MLQDQEQQQQPKRFLAPPPTPGEGCKLKTYRYHFEMLEPEIVSQASVPFAEINDQVDAFVPPANANLIPTPESLSTNKKDANDDVDVDDQQKEESIITAKTSKLLRVLDEFGFAIIPDILSTNLELETMRSLFSQDLLSIIAKPPMSDAEKFAEVAADPINHWPERLSLGHTFCSDFGLVHGRLAWHVRCHPKVKTVFSTIYDQEQDLCTGIDNLFFSNRPAEDPLWEVEVATKKKSEELVDDDEQNEALKEENCYGEDMWPHCDQNMQELPAGGWKIFQSALYVNETNAKTSTTVLWPRSHREITPKMFEEKQFIMGHYCPLPNSLKPAYLRKCRRIPVPAGGLLIWNSRTIHQGWNNGPRLAVPVCLEPKSRRDEKALERKKKMVLKGQPSTHWASLGHPHDLGFNEKPRERDGLTVVSRAHRYLFANSDKAGQIPQDVLDML